eukprot:1138319-Pelagomonas_calceolata.AAC.2
MDGADILGAPPCSPEVMHMHGLVDGTQKSSPVLPPASTGQHKGFHSLLHNPLSWVLPYARHLSLSYTPTMRPTFLTHHEVPVLGAAVRQALISFSLTTRLNFPTHSKVKAHSSNYHYGVPVLGAALRQTHIAFLLTNHEAHFPGSS